MHFGVVTQVAPLAHMSQVVKVPAQRVTRARAVLCIQVSGCQHDPPARPYRGSPVALNAPTRAGMIAVQSTFTLALALIARPRTDRRHNRVIPIMRIFCFGRHRAIPVCLLKHIRVRDTDNERCANSCTPESACRAGFLNHTGAQQVCRCQARFSTRHTA